jgi:hypothetical protein
MRPASGTRASAGVSGAAAFPRGPIPGLRRHRAQRRVRAPPDSFLPDPEGLARPAHNGRERIRPPSWGTCRGIAARCGGGRFRHRNGRFRDVNTIDWKGPCARAPPWRHDCGCGCGCTEALTDRHPPGGTATSRDTTGGPARFSTGQDRSIPARPAGGGSAFALAPDRDFSPAPCEPAAVGRRPPPLRSGAPPGQRGRTRPLTHCHAPARGHPPRTGRAGPNRRTQPTLAAQLVCGAMDVALFQSTALRAGSRGPARGGPGAAGVTGDRPAKAGWILNLT